MQLYIGNKNYSSWSLRTWLLMKHAGIPFEEVKLRLSWDPASDFKHRLAAVSPAARVPVLIDEGFAIWDTLAIAEYLAEKYPAKRLWPEAPLARARARSLCAEMHGGFAALRSHFGMNIEASLGDIGRKVLAEQPEAARDLARIVQMWEQQLHEQGGPFLFGAGFTIPDAYFAPVCWRIRTYALPVSAPVQAYVERILGLPAMQEWTAAAVREHDWVEEDEPYRKKPA
jgi:glutathione S-transferase